MDYEVMNLRAVAHENPDYGGLSFVESRHDIPFEFKRLYWIYGVQADVHRGFHAHKLNEQLLVCPHGSIEIILDDGVSKETVLLDRPDKGLLLHCGLWREMVWIESDSVLCVAASEYYDPKEYIRDYSEFLKYIAEKDKNEKRTN